MMQNGELTKFKVASGQTSGPESNIIFELERERNSMVPITYDAQKHDLVLREDVNLAGTEFLALPMANEEEESKHQKQASHLTKELGYALAVQVTAEKKRIEEEIK